MSVNVSAREAGFEIGPYLEQRAEKPDFVMVEIGHGANPVADKQPFDFINDRAYIGIEGRLRYPKAGFKEKNQYAQRGDRNIFYLSQDLGGKVERPFPEEESSYAYYEGEYDSKTILPDQAADEVFAGNVFCDPLVAFNEARVSNLLTECARLLSRNGTIILRESITPHYSKEMADPDFLALFGLKMAARIWKVVDRKKWELLDKTFAADANLYGRPDSYYLFLSKISLD